MGRAPGNGSRAEARSLGDNVVDGPRVRRPTQALPGPTAIPYSQHPLRRSWPLPCTAPLSTLMCRDCGSCSRAARRRSTTEAFCTCSPHPLQPRAPTPRGGSCVLHSPCVTASSSSLARPRPPISCLSTSPTCHSLPVSFLAPLHFPGLHLSFPTVSPRTFAHMQPSTSPVGVRCDLPRHAARPWPAQNLETPPSRVGGHTRLHRSSSPRGAPLSVRPRPSRTRSIRLTSLPRTRAPPPPSREPSPFLLPHWPSPAHPRASRPAHPGTVLVCLGGPRSAAGHLHAVFIAANGDFLMEHVSAQALQVPLTPSDLSSEAFATYTSVLASPPPCCRFGPAAAVPPPRPPRLPSEARPAWHFYPFPLPLPPDVYRAPPLSEILAIPGPVLYLKSDARPLVPPPPSFATPPPPPPVSVCACKPSIPRCSRSPPRSSLTAFPSRAQRMLTGWGVDITTPTRQCYFPYLESALKGYFASHPGADPPTHLLTHHVSLLDDPCPTLAASPSCHPFVLGKRPYFMGPRALASKQGLPPTDPLYQALLLATPRVALLALGRGVHHLAACSVLYFIRTEASSPLLGRTDWRCASAFTGADTFGAALRACVPEYQLLAASEVRPPSPRRAFHPCALAPSPPPVVPPPTGLLTEPPLLPPGTQPDRHLRDLVHACYPKLPPENFPTDVRDDGAFPSVPYDFSFWGFPCIKHSSLNRTVTEADLRQALDLLCAAFHRLAKNPPAVFVLENTYSLVAGPRWVLAQITAMLQLLPYDWRLATAPALPLSPPLPPPSHPSPRLPPVRPPPLLYQVLGHLPSPALRRRLFPSTPLVGGVPPHLAARHPPEFPGDGGPSPPRCTRGSPVRLPTLCMFFRVPMFPFQVVVLVRQLPPESPRARVRERCCHRLGATPAPRLPCWATAPCPAACTDQRRPSPLGLHLHLSLSLPFCNPPPSPEAPSPLCWCPGSASRTRARRRCLTEAPLCVPVPSFSPAHAPLLPAASALCILLASHAEGSHPRSPVYALPLALASPRAPTRLSASCPPLAPPTCTHPHLPPGSHGQDTWCLHLTLAWPSEVRDEVLLSALLAMAG